LTEYCLNLYHFITQKSACRGLTQRFFCFNLETLLENKRRKRYFLRELLLPFNKIILNLIEKITGVLWQMLVSESSVIY